MFLHFGGHLKVQDVLRLGLLFMHNGPNGSHRVFTLHGVGNGNADRIVRKMTYQEALRIGYKFGSGPSALLFPNRLYESTRRGAQRCLAESTTHEMTLANHNDVIFQKAPNVIGCRSNGLGKCNGLRQQA